MLQRALLEELNARRRVRFYQTRQAITYNWNHVVSFRQRTINRVNKIQSDVRHKSLMRIIGSYISMKPVKRVKIQVSNDLRFKHCSIQRGTETLLSLQSSHSLTDPSAQACKNAVGHEKNISTGQ